MKMLSIWIICTDGPAGETKRITQLLLLIGSRIFEKVFSVAL
jgi:hypothetical protein